MPAGRPTLYRPEYCERVIECGREGMSEVEIAVEIGVLRTTMLAWTKSQPEFLTALTRARQESQAWWEKAGRNGEANSVIGPAIWKHSMNCRFRDDYGDRMALGGADDMPPIKGEVTHRADEFTRRIVGLAASEGSGG